MAIYYTQRNWVSTHLFKNVFLEMLDFIRKGLFRLRRYSDGLSRTEELTELMIPSPMVPERDLLRLVEQSRQEDMFTHAALSIRTQIRTDSRSKSGISEVSSENLEVMKTHAESCLLGGRSNREEMFFVLDYRGRDVEKKYRSATGVPGPDYYYYYYVDTIIKGNRKMKRLIHIGELIVATVSVEVGRE